ncbi:glycosyltransferase family 4 protein [Candidatus Woesearchaeota archaeon]|nr:glycosyltransferase family 4 protein [Candidatus Woesearchaeota archaeon]
MKYLVITNTDANHVRIVYLLKEMLSRNEEVHLMCSGSSGEDSLRNIYGDKIHLHKFPVDTKRFSNLKMFRYLMFFMSAKGSIAKVIDEIKPDVVYAYNLLSGYPTMKAMHGRDIPFYFDMTDFFYEIFRSNMNLDRESFVINKIKKMEQDVVNSSTKVFTVSEAFRKAIMGFSEKKKEDIIVVHEGADIEVFRPGEKDKEISIRYNLKDKLVITFVGGIEKHDNLDMVVETAKSLCEVHKNVIFLIVGDGKYLPTVKELVKSYNLEEFFVFTGWIPFRIINTYLSVSDIAILVYSNTMITRYVGTTKLYEYLACGIPVVSHDLLGTREVLGNNEYGLLFTCDDKEMFTEKLKKLIEDPELRKELGKKARELVVEKYNVLNQSKKMVDAMRV